MDDTLSKLYLLGFTVIQRRTRLSTVYWKGVVPVVKAADQATLDALLKGIHCVWRLQLPVPNIGVENITSEVISALQSLGFTTQRLGINLFRLHWSGSLILDNADYPILKAFLMGIRAAWYLIIPRIFSNQARYVMNDNSNEIASFLDWLVDRQEIGPKEVEEFLKS